METGQYPAAPRPAAAPATATMTPPTSTATVTRVPVAPAPSVPPPGPTVTRDADVESVAPVRPRRRGAGLLPGFHNRPPFGRWLRDNWLDIFTMILCLVAALLIYLFVPPLLPRYFALYPGIETSSWGLKYAQPYRHEYITTATSALVSYLVPAVIMGAIVLWGTRNFSDGNAALIGLGYALATATLFQALIKVLIGGLRPNFLHACNPRMPTSFEFVSASQACRGNAHVIRQSQMSFPSGHASAAFAGFGFLALYINAKYKVFGRGRRSGFPHDAATTDTAPVSNTVSQADSVPAAASVPATNGSTASRTVQEKETATGAKARRPQHWKLLFFTLPWLAAVLLSLTKIRDGWHHPIDVLIGALIGTAFAHMAFRMVYKSVYDARDNHIPQEG